MRTSAIEGPFQVSRTRRVTTASSKWSALSSGFEGASTASIRARTMASALPATSKSRGPSEQAGEASGNPRTRGTRTRTTTMRDFFMTRSSKGETPTVQVAFHIFFRCDRGLRRRCAQEMHADAVLGKSGPRNWHASCSLQELWPFPTERRGLKGRKSLKKTKKDERKDPQ